METDLARKPRGQGRKTKLEASSTIQSEYDWGSAGGPGDGILEQLKCRAWEEDGGQG